MSQKKQLIHLKKARKLAKLEKIEAKNEILVEDIFFVSENKSTKES